MAEQSIHCPHCDTYLGKAQSDGSYKVRLAIVLSDGDRVYGPCSKCKKDVTIAKGAVFNKSLCRSTSAMIPGLRLTGPRRGR